MVFLVVNDGSGALTGGVERCGVDIPLLIWSLAMVT
jgi:hypothetical protein